MTIQSLDLRSLEIFRAVALEGSVSRAAEKLNRVQSNVSTRLKQLEQRLEKDLFVRSGRGLKLTEDGTLLLAYAERLLQLSAEAADALNEGKPRGLFRIGTMESTAAARLPETLSNYHTRHPDVRIELETGTTGWLIDRLQAHDVEAAFIAEPLSVEGITTAPVFEEALVLVAPKSFPPLDRPEAISGRTIVAFETGCAYRRYLEDWILDAGIMPGTVMTVGSYLAILACVAAGTGYAVVPQSVLNVVTSQGAFQLHPLPGRYARIKTLLAWRADYCSAKLDALRQLLPTPGAAA
jgi:DNA-binding transcriptional LysR family regulator